MLLKEIQTLFHKELNSLFPKEEIDSFFYRMVEHYLGFERFILVMQPQLTLTKEEEQPLFEGLTRLRNEEPLQYILGQTQFMDLEFTVNEHVLIPRPETEELVQWVLDDMNVRKPSCKILDIGTGSGCISIALAWHLSEAEVWAIDISKNALEVAKKNAAVNKVSINFVQADILKANFDFAQQFDVIVSNPPYVRESEKKDMKDNVKKYEPKGALFVADENPLIFYRAIVEFSKIHLKSGGRLFLEINQYLPEQTEQFLVNNGFHEVEMQKDIFGNFRMLKGIKK